MWHRSTPLGERRKIMLDIVKKAMLTGIGMALLAKDEVEELAREVVEKGKMTEQDGKKFLHELQSRYEDVQDKLEDRVEKSVRDILKKMDVVTGEDLKAIKKEIRALKTAINKDATSA
jgi:polyhydroxyalkanoate synthesis regulator phasin